MTKPRMLPRLVVAALFACGLWAQGDWRFADPNSTLLAGLNWRSTIDSPIGPSLKAAIVRFQSTALLGPAIDQVDSLRWSSTTAQKSGRTTTQWVLALAGRFDPDALSAQLGALGYVPQAYRSLTLLVPTRSTSRAVQLAIVDAGTILLADADPLRRAVDRILDSAGAPQNPLFAQSDALAAGNELWVVGSGSPLVLYPRQVPAIVASLPPVQGYSLALALRDSPALKLSLAANSAAEADVFVQLLRLLPLALKVQPAERQLLQAVWAQAQFTQENGVARAVIPLDPLLRALVP